MKSLFNGCSRSEISVLPKNWNTRKASIKKPWVIHYRFYDPVFKADPGRWAKSIHLKGMNRYKTLEERQDATRALLDNEIDLMDKKGYNPITKQYMAPQTDHGQETGPDILFIPALWAAFYKLDAIPDTLIDIKSVIKGVETAAGQLYDNTARVYYNQLPIADISRKHIKYILDQCGQNNQRWSAGRFNKYKAYLSMLFVQLVELEAVESNPTKEINCKKKTVKQRELLTAEELKRVNEKLLSERYSFWRYLQIFHRSGSRTTEMLSLVNDHKIDLAKQEFQVLVKKGDKFRWDIRPIHNSVLNLWQEILSKAAPGDYLFSNNLEPGKAKIGKSQICRRWNRYVKADPIDESKRKRKDQVGGLGIKKDFYSLKHLNTDNIARALDIRHAQVADGHTTPVITIKNYAVGEKQRELDRLKNW